MDVKVNRIIETDADVSEGLAALTARCPRLAHAASVVDRVPLRRRPDGFPELLSAIVSQQVSVAAASAILERLQAAGLADPAQILASDDEDLRDCGLSRQKIRYVRSLAEAGIDYPALRSASDDAVISTLVEVPGIGRWTAEIYTMFALGRADVFAAGDLALQEAVKLLYGLSERPTESELRKRADAWQPWRAVAARLLWAYYRVIKSREGIR